MIKFFKTKELEAVGDKYGCLDCPYYAKMNCPKDENEGLICNGGYFREVIDEETIPEPTPNPKPNSHKEEIELLDRFAIAVLPSINLKFADAIAEAAYEFAVEMLKRRKEVIKTLDE